MMAIEISCTGRGGDGGLESRRPLADGAVDESKLRWPLGLTMSSREGFIM